MDSARADWTSIAPRALPFPPPVLWPISRPNATHCQVIDPAELPLVALRLPANLPGRMSDRTPTAHMLLPALHGLDDPPGRIADHLPARLDRGKNGK